MNCMTHTPYGYYIKDGSAVLDAVKAKQVKVLFQEYVAGASLQTIADNIGIPRKHASIGRMIEDKRYIGDGFYPAIVGRDIWNRAQTERARRTEKFGRNKNYFALDKTKISPFWGLVYCTECGSEFRRYAGKDREHWRCSRYVVKGKINCRSFKVSENLFEDAFIRMIDRIDLNEIAVKPKLEPVTIKQQFSDPIKQAEYLYSTVKVDDFDYITDKLLTVLKDKPIDFNGDFMRRIIKSIKVVKGGTAVFELINHKLIKEELSLNDS